MIVEMLPQMSSSRLISAHQHHTQGLDLLSDKALVGFLKVIVEINRDVQLLSYRNDARLSSGDEKGFLLRMGFGLHAGWAIEGAVGSLQKVDATYLSPHVNMAARMEAATRQFGVSILITRSFFKVSILLLCVKCCTGCRQ
jgi:class 3 adenylate cyclase